MDKLIVEESADELLFMAESDIVTIKVLFNETFYPAGFKNNIICFHTTQAVEKLLKGYINRNEITKQDMVAILKSLENICNFPPIKAMRDSFSKKHQYEIVAEITTKPAGETTADTPE